MSIHKEGFKIIRNVLLGLLLLNLFVGFLLNHWIFYCFLFVSFLIYSFVLYFFRIPSRSIINNEKQVISSADGSIVAIEKVEENTYFKCKMWQVSVFMSPLNIHVNHFPVSGKIVHKQHDPGKYWVAWHPKSSSENERTSIVIQNQTGIKIMVRQIAGAVARRIVTYPKLKDTCIQGEELGFIKFGSRVDIFLPLEAEILVALNQKVKSKKTILAKIQ